MTPGHTPLTIADALAQAGQAGLARLDAQLLLLHALGKSTGERAWLISHDDAPIAENQRAGFERLVRQRLAGVPVAYLVGQREFYGLPLSVTPAVLDPRADTETLVDWALECLHDTPRPRVLDLGTGSGAIALAIKSQRADAQVFATDRSAAALAVARRNAGALGLQVTCIEGSWLAPVAEHALGAFDLIVSNPPYLADDDPHLASLAHEPTQALVSGHDGLDDIRTIASAAGRFLVRGGWLLLEHGWDQHPAVRAILHDAGFTPTACRRDLANHIRCTGACKP